MEGVDTGPMRNEVISQGMTVYGISHRLGQQVDFSKYDSKGCIVCYGDIDFIRQVTTRAPFIPGAFCNFHNMKCSTYYAYFGKYLLNGQYMMMPVGDLLTKWEEFCESLFVRPDSGAKPFIGYVVAPNEKDKIQTLVQSVGPETLVVIAPEQKIETEWRFVICDKKVIAGCEYLPTERSYPITPWIKSSKPPLFRLAEEIASQEWQPDLCYTIDIAETDLGEIRLLEINSFSCAGLYCCDMSSVIHHVSEVAGKEWKEYL